MTEQRLDVSVIIPTYRRAEKLARCVDRLARQGLSADRFEVLVGLDGADDASARGAIAAWRAAGGREGGLRVEACEKRGYNATRNAILPLARGRLMVSMNDDVLAEPGFLAAHVAAHAEADVRAAGRPTIVVGHSPFVAWERPTLFDDLCAHTSMIFFYDRMIGPTAELAAADPDHDWGFRHCYGLNFSTPLDVVRELGGFVSFDGMYGYDDIELAWRLKRKTGARLVFRPAARAEHDHRYTPSEVLERERKLGASAWLFAGREPEFCLEVFGRDIRSAGEVAYSREFVRREASTVARIERSFLILDTISACALNGQHARDLREVVYQQQLLLRRWWWRKGLVESADADVHG